MSFEIDETVRKLELEIINALEHPSEEVRSAVGAMLRRVAAPPESEVIELKRSCGFGTYHNDGRGEN